MKVPVALTIAGSDPSGGAGVQADLKTFHQRGVYGASAVTLLTVQNTQRVDAVQVLAPELVEAQVRAVIEDIPPAAAKTGALGDERVVRLVAELAEGFDFPLVVDPVMVSKHGRALLTAPARRALGELLLPRAHLVTPNLPEAEELAGMPVRDLDGMKAAAVAIVARGARAALVKGGHLEGGGRPVDVLYSEATGLMCLDAPRIETRHTHGTGCTYSACITAELAKGAPLADAVTLAKEFITRAVESAPGLGRGSGPVNHFADVPDARSGRRRG
ncbi:MAG: bifunctional hydroxymethylpyrimidine kinase/phosphomethylpyrimidine kinase [Acidobacteriota bacterium]|jgi:hydroxymethylpyrimidine/phosphomethylpyrimidine kinase|nr:bifunctional hydroxymethylpyrimidine kinase/phosphomethylpyrimidine kinase [Acidobacteriota bacterium]